MCVLTLAVKTVRVRVNKTVEVLSPDYTGAAKSSNTPWGGYKLTTTELVVMVIHG